MARELLLIVDWGFNLVPSWSRLRTDKHFRMPIARDLLKVIPIGEENAVTGRLLWKQLGMWSADSIKHKLNEMAAAGLIERKRVLREARSTSLYFRRHNSSAGL